MQFYGDYHTHTKYSDGKGTIEENVAAARSRGLKEAAITDHGFRNMFCLRPRDVDKQKKEIEYCQKKYPDIKIYHGIEADLVGLDGRVDMDKRAFKDFDLVIAGYHPSALAYNLRDWYYIHAKTYYSAAFKPTKEIIRRNTRAAIEMIKRYDIDIYPHVNHSFIVDIAELAKACSDYGTYMELNVKHIDELSYRRLFESGAPLVAGSDAHTPDAVGGLDAAADFAVKNGFDAEAIVNLKNPIVLKNKR
ncbi:MAG: PHP domain-containing protein [Clostridiales bacterium]|jgi:putative hydrolase|nr:PHP domain-containing protein [Clostridiales bacterium]